MPSGLSECNFKLNPPLQQLPISPLGYEWNTSWTKQGTASALIISSALHFHKHLYSIHTALFMSSFPTTSHKITSIVSLLKPEAGLHLHGPGKFRKQRLVKYFLNGHLMALAPSHGDTRIHVVNLRGAQGHGLEIILHTHV